MIDICKSGLLTRDFVVQGVFKVSEASGWDVSEVAATEVRILLLYCTQAESGLILGSAAAAGLTSPEYLWMVTQSVVGDPNDRSSSRKSLPVGMIGEKSQVDQIDTVLLLICQLNNICTYLVRPALDENFPVHFRPRRLNHRM